ncbi:MULTISPECIES: YoaK family protein [Arthrobacter]|uniref:YoaK family protein n=2 Tax=Arthrobacter TaxID=1663 RepID=A0ABU9KLU9_9MICC|nr:YoaK family protein [Arthrobacter sp. YJM1]MDP5228183.1 YoaK family protein [Arthrobacter sp. YJM1]
MAASLPWRGILYAGGLSAVAGFIDAVAYIHLGGYFVSFMSGNTTRASSDLVHGSLTGAGLALGLIGFFSLGVVLSTLAFRNAGTRRLPAVLATTTALIALAALLPALSAGVVVPPLLAMAMGVVNTSYTRNGEVSIALTYMTGTLVKTGQHFAAALTGAEPHGVWLRHFTLWSMIAAGAVVGAVSYSLTGLTSLWFAAAMLLCWTTVALRRAQA